MNIRYPIYEGVYRILTIIIRFIVYKFCHVFMAIVSCPAAFGAISLSAF